MTHGVFPIEMFCCIVVEILLILETMLQSCQSWPINWRSCRWVAFELLSRPDGISDFCTVILRVKTLIRELTSMWVLTLCGNGLTGTLELIAVTVCSPIERSKLIVSAKSCSVSAPLRRVWVSTSGRLTLARALAKALMDDWWTRSISCLSCSSLRDEMLRIHLKMSSAPGNKPF